MGSSERKSPSVSDLQMEVSKLRAENSQLKMERKILKKGAGVLRGRITMKYAAIASMRVTYQLQMLCNVFCVSKSGYCEWKRRIPSLRAQANSTLVGEIRSIHAKSFGAYGSPRIYESLKQCGRIIGLERIRRLMQVNRIIGRHRKKRCRTTDSNHRLPIAANRLRQHFQCAKPNAVWLGDITYVATDAGFLYVAAMKDLCTKKMVGWSMSACIDAQL